MYFQNGSKCKHLECKMSALYNYENSIDGEYCNEHKLENMIKVSNVGEKWTENEKNKLLKELEENLDIETIAKNHKRQIGGIISRIKYIANEMYMNGCSTDEIISKTKISSDEMLKITKKNEDKKNNEKKKINVKLSDCANKVNSENEITNELYELRKKVSEINDAITKLIVKMEKKSEPEPVCLLD